MSDPQTVPSKLRSVIADVFGVSPDEITAGAGVNRLEGWDSFGHLQAILALESEFGVQFDPQRIPELTTVAKIQAELEGKGVSWA
jgi:acyl carrier protein